MTAKCKSWTRRWRLSIVGGASLLFVAAALWILWPRSWAVMIVTSPPGARVLNESRVIGTTPIELKLARARSKLTLQLDGYETHKIFLDSARRQSSVKLALVPLPLTYTLNVQPPHVALSVQEPGATLAGNGQRRTLTVAEPNSERTYTLVAKLDNFADVVRTVRPVPGKTESLDIEFPAQLVFDFPQLGVPFTVQYDDVELPGGDTRLTEASNINGHRLQITAAGISFVDRQLPPNFPGETIRIAVPPHVAVYKVGRLPLGIGLKATATAGAARDNNGCHWVVVPGNEEGKAAEVTVTAGETVLSTLGLPPFDRVAGPPVEWAMYEIEGGSADTTLIVQGEGHVLRHPDGREWMLVPRPDGKRWVKLSAVRPGFKEIARLLTPISGERSAVRLDMSPLAPPFEYVLPEDIVVFVNVSNYGSFKRRLNELRGVQLCQSPVMQPFVSRFLGKSEQSVGQIREQTGIDVVNLCAAHTGQIVLAWAPDIQGTPGTKGTKATKATKKVPAKKAVEATPGTPSKPGSSYFLSDVPGSRGSILAMLDEMRRIGNVGEGFISVTDDDVLIGAVDSTSAEQVVARLGNKPTDSFAFNHRLTEFRDRAGGTGDFEMFVDLKRILPNFLFTLFSVYPYLPVYLGLSQFESAGISFSIAQDQFDTLCHLLVITDGRPALFEFLAMPLQLLKPEPWVPADVTGYYSFTFDHTKLDSFLPLLGSQHSALQGLGDRLTLVTDFTESRGFLVPRVLVVWDLKNAPGNANSIRRFLEVKISTIDGPDIVNLRNKEGQEIYILDYGRQLEQSISDDKPVPFGKVALVVTETHVMLTTHVELLEKILNHQGPGLADSPNYLRVAAHFPKECSLIAYQSPDQNRLLFQALKTGRLPGFINESTELIKVFGGLVEALDGSQLPDYEAVKQYLTPAGGYGVMNDSGFHYTHFTLNR